MRAKLTGCGIGAVLFVLFTSGLLAPAEALALDVGLIRQTALIHYALLFLGLTAVAAHFNRSAHRSQFRLQSANNQLSIMAQTDQLTQLYNRRYILSAIEQEMEMFKIKQKPFSLAIADIDNFKSINDYFGHNEGDRGASAGGAVHPRDPPQGRYCGALGRRGICVPAPADLP